MLVPLLALTLDRLAGEGDIKRPVLPLRQIGLPERQLSEADFASVAFDRGSEEGRRVGRGRDRVCVSDEAGSLLGPPVQGGVVIDAGRGAALDEYKGRESEPGGGGGVLSSGAGRRCADGLTQTSLSLFLLAQAGSRPCLLMNSS